MPDHRNIEPSWCHVATYGFSEVLEAVTGNATSMGNAESG